MGKGKGHGPSDSNASLPIDDELLQREDSLMLAKDRLGHANDSITVAKGREMRQIVDQQMRDASCQPVINTLSEASMQRRAPTTISEDPQHAESPSHKGSGNSNRMSGFLKSCMHEETAGKGTGNEASTGTGESSIRKSSIVRFSEGSGNKHDRREN